MVGLGLILTHNGRKNALQNNWYSRNLLIAIHTYNDSQGCCKIKGRWRHVYIFLASHKEKDKSIYLHISYNELTIDTQKDPYLCYEIQNLRIKTLCKSKMGGDQKSSSDIIKALTSMATNFISTLFRFINFH